MVLVLTQRRDWLAARKKILAWPAFLLLPLSILFVRYYPQLGRTFGQWDYAMSWTGVSSTKNGLGMISMVFGLASASRFLDALWERQNENRTRVLIAHGTILAMAIYLLEMAHSATSLACFVFREYCAGRDELAFACPIPGILPISGLGLTVHFFFFSLSQLRIEFRRGFGEKRNADGPDWKSGPRFVTLVKDPVFGTGFESFWIGPGTCTNARARPRPEPGT